MQKSAYKLYTMPEKVSIRTIRGFTHLTQPTLCHIIIIGGEMRAAKI